MILLKYRCTGCQMTVETFSTDDVPNHCGSPMNRLYKASAAVGINDRAHINKWDYYGVDPHTGKGVTAFTDVSEGAGIQIKE